jgi:glycosyltransferase involved in cell wall biosynthesis
MKVLIINYRYFVSGGPEQYMFKLETLLEQHGHTVIPFSITYDRNQPSDYASYFAEPLSDSSEVYFRDQSRSLRAYAVSLERAFYSPAVYRKLDALITATQPDVAYVLHYLRKLSPSVLKCLSDHGVPFGVFLSDFAMVCPNAHLMRDSAPCERCVSGSLRHSVRYSCVQGSRAASAVNYIATKFHNAAGYFDLIQTFVAPSQFMKTKMVDGGWEPERVVHIPMFVSPGAGQAQQSPAYPTIAYVGRLDHTKGVHTLLEATRILNARRDLPHFEIRVAGTGEPDYTNRLKRLAGDYGLTNVTFDGWQTREQITDMLRSARCAVVPSLWYENTPNAALESMAEATPIVASNHGCFPELVDDGRSGLLFRPGDPGDLAEKLRLLLQDPDLGTEMGHRALDFVRVAHSPEKHYGLLMQMFAKLQTCGTLTRTS